MALPRQAPGWRDWLGLVRTSQLLIFLLVLWSVLGLASVALFTDHPIHPWWVGAIGTACCLGAMAIDGRRGLLNKRLGEIHRAHLRGHRAPLASRLLSVLGTGLVLIYFSEVARLA